LPEGATHIDVEDLAGKPFILPTGAFQRSLNALFSAHGVVVDTMVEASLGVVAGHVFELGRADEHEVRRIEHEHGPFARR
jgi:hypothetical protein